MLADNSCGKKSDFFALKIHFLFWFLTPSKWELVSILEKCILCESIVLDSILYWYLQYISMYMQFFRQVVAFPVRYYHQILLLSFSEFERINGFLMISGEKKLIHLVSLNNRSAIWRRFLNWMGWAYFSVVVIRVIYQI